MKSSVLVIAGSDSSGGAGVDADREALRAQGAEALVVVTAWTKQDDRGLRELGAVAADEWTAEAREQLESAAEALGAVKFGLLPGMEAVRAAAEFIAELQRTHPDMPIVLDPILASSSGHEFLDASAQAALRELLLPLGLVWTPNLPEAATLTGREPSLSRVAREATAGELVERGARAVVLKGGHAQEDLARDLVLERNRAPHWLEHPRVRGGGIRGSGCRFASVLAAELAFGSELEVAARSAGDYVLERIRRASCDDEQG